MEMRDTLRDVRDRIHVNLALCREVVHLAGEHAPELAKRIEALWSVGSENMQRNITSISSLIEALAEKQAA